MELRIHPEDDCWAVSEELRTSGGSGGSVLTEDGAQPPVTDHNDLCHDSSDGQTRLKRLISHCLMFQIKNEVNLMKCVVVLCDLFQI